jgi:enolase
MGIKSIVPSQVLNSNGEPTLKVRMVAENGTSSWFIVPAGSSLGIGEAEKKTDNGDSYGGKSVASCVDLINKIVSPKFIGYPLKHQDDFDSLVIALDGTDNKQNLGANTILALSGAYFKLSAKLSKKPLWQYIAENRKTTPKFPRIYANLVGGGKHAPGLDIQEFMIVPKSTNPIESIEMIVQVYQTIKTIMVSLYGPAAQLVGDEGAIAPVGVRTEVVLEAIANLREKMDSKFEIALDIAANSFYNGKNYVFEGNNAHASDLLAAYQAWDQKFDLFSLEDPFAETDLEGLELLKSIPSESKPFQIISDDFTVTDSRKINDFAKEKVFDGIIIKPDQVGSISEMFAAIDMAREVGNEVIISHRSGESNDDFIVDLAYGVGAYGIKVGAPVRGERIAKYNRLLEIQYSLDSTQPSKESANMPTQSAVLNTIDGPRPKPLKSIDGDIQAPPKAMTPPRPVTPSATRDDKFANTNNFPPQPPRVTPPISNLEPPTPIAKAPKPPLIPPQPSETKAPVIGQSNDSDIIPTSIPPAMPSPVIAPAITSSTQSAEHPVVLPNTAPASQPITIPATPSSTLVSGFPEAVNELNPLNRSRDEFEDNTASANNNGPASAL